MTNQLIRSELCDGVAVAHLDDGKANAFSHDMIAAIGEHLDRFGGEEATKAVLLTGRAGVLSGLGSARERTKAAGLGSPRRLCSGSA